MVEAATATTAFTTEFMFCDHLVPADRQIVGSVRARMFFESSSNSRNQHAVVKVLIIRGSRRRLVAVPQLP